VTRTSGLVSSDDHQNEFVTSPASSKEISLSDEIDKCSTRGAVSPGGASIAPNFLTTVPTYLQNNASDNDGGVHKFLAITAQSSGASICARCNKREEISAPATGPRQQARAVRKGTGIAQCHTNIRSFHLGQNE